MFTMLTEKRVKNQFVDFKYHNCFVNIVFFVNTTSTTWFPTNIFSNFTSTCYFFQDGHGLLIIGVFKKLLSNIPSVSKISLLRNSLYSILVDVINSAVVFVGEI